MQRDSTTSVVLVHGAWHGVWCWERVVSGLAAEGVPAVAVELPGHGEDPGPMRDLHADAARVRQVLDTLTPPVVLLGHSYGGAVITEAGDHPSVGHLVYLCAMALDEGESCMVASPEEPGADHRSPEGRPDLATGLIIADDVMTIDPETAAAALFNQCDESTTAWAVSRLGPQPLVTMQQPVEVVSWRDKPTSYVVCSDDRIVHPDLQRWMAKRCAGTIVEWDSDHSPFLSHPELVVDLLTELAR